MKNHKFKILSPKCTGKLTRLRKYNLTIFNQLKVQHLNSLQKYGRMLENQFFTPYLIMITSTHTQDSYQTRMTLLKRKLTSFEINFNKI